MSLILEALRKSETERRRGEAPDLRMELPPPVPPKRRVAPLARIGGGMLAGLMLLAALWSLDNGDDPIAGATDTGTAGATPGSVPVPDRSAGADADDAMRHDLPGGSTGTNAGGDPFPAVERIRPPEVTPAPAPVAVRAPEEAIPDGPAPSTAQGAPATIPASGATRIGSLASSQRERLPGLKLSLHMWNEDPARRFAVIDGQRRIEGDRLGDATITAIDREGVLLDLDGQAVRVPLP